MKGFLCSVVLCSLLAAGCSASAATGSATDVLQGFREDVRNTLETGEVGYIVGNVSQVLQLPEVFLNGGGDQVWEEEEDKEDKNSIFCRACSIAVQELLDLVNGGISFDVLFNVSITVCLNLNISNLVVCENMLEILKPQISWILTNADLTGKDMCATLFTAENCQSDNPDRVWDVEMPDVPKPDLVVPDIPTDGPTIKVLHLADTHYDPEYLPGGNANCPELVFCCRAESGEVLHPNDAAGYWGDYRFCDSPRWTLESIYTHIQEQHPDISFIIWTGDLMPHNVWNTSREGNLKIIRDSVALVQEYFPGIPVFPAIGNHEAHPVNGYPQPYIDNEFDISWLYDEIAEIWQTWLPANVAERIMYSASYVTEVFQNLRIISLNTNYCYSSNWWLLYDSNDPGEELYWLAQELQRAEDDGVFVYIISHIPTGDPNCQYSWSHQHNKIIARYEGVIAGLFYGHTHKDHFQVFFDPDQPDRTIEVAYIAESQTPYKKLNPGYKVYTVDAGRPEATYTVLDHENWYFDLDQANFEGSPTFQLLYTAKEEYGMSDLSAQSHLDLIYRMAANSTLFDLFYKNYVKAARPSLEGGCNSVCKDELLCKLITADRSDLSHCDTLP